MSKRSRYASSRMYSLKRFIDKVSSLKPSTNLVAVVALAAVIFILGGGIYNLASRPLVILPLRGRWIFYYPYRVNEQMLNESVTVMILYALGVTGLIFIYQSTKYLYKPRRAFASLIFGITLLLIAFFSVEYLLGLKGF